jgi:ubiquinone/menaquinone biosynthesis C-methylase UbiE
MMYKVFCNSVCLNTLSFTAKKDTKMELNAEEFNIRQAEAFKEHGVVDVYRYRVPYVPEVFDLLAGLLVGESRAVLDVCTGSGDIARPLVARVERVDAVDFSQSMIEQGQKLPNGDHPHLRWIYGKVENVELDPPYGLVTAGSSIHWLEWETVFPLFRSILTPGGSVALIMRRILPMPWSDELKALRVRYAEVRNHRALTAHKDVVQQGFLQQARTQQTSPVPFQQSIDDFIEAQHSFSRFTRERIGLQRSYEYDQEARSLLQRYHPDNILPLQIAGVITSGIPAGGV